MFRNMADAWVLKGVEQQESSFNFIVKGSDDGV
jgi:hypothetical protein